MKHAHPQLRFLGATDSVATDLCTLLLPGSGHLQEEVAKYAHEKGSSRHSPPVPLYTAAAEVVQMESLSAHADSDGLIEWMRDLESISLEDPT